MRKKFTKLVTVLGLTTLLTINTLAASFTDVTTTHWAYDEIVYMQENGYLLKNSAGQFLPNEKMNYFDYAELLAKISGYVDEKFVPDMDPELKEKIAMMYEQQMPYIEQYDNDDRYKTWTTSANEEIAYVLAIGYMNQNDLGRFMVKSATGQEAKKVLTKQELARYLVFYIGKANTAKAEYTGTTGFEDDALIREENKPYVAYLKRNGLVSGDSENNFGANTEVTRALASFMTVGAIEFREELNKEAETAPEPTPELEEEPESDKGDTQEEPSVSDFAIGEVKNFIPKNDGTGEYLLLLEVNGESSFLIVDDKTQLTNALNETIDKEAIKVGNQVIVVAGSDDHIDQLIVTSLVDGAEDEKDETDDRDEEETDDEQGPVAVYKGEVQWVGRNGDLTIKTDGGAVVFDVSDDCVITDGSEEVAFEKLEAGDEVTIKVEDDEITNIIITKKVVVEEEEVEISDVTYVSTLNRLNSYIVTVKDGEALLEIEVPLEVDIRRDGKRTAFNELRIGDVLTFEYEEDEVVEIQAESSESRIEGIVRSVLIAQMPEVVIETEDGDVTVAITTDTEIYDENTREDMTIREIYLGSQVEVRTESSEALSFIIEKAPSRVNYKGTIEKIWSGSRSIDVLVEYDAETGEDMVIKTFSIPTETMIEIDGDESHRNDLEEGMEVLIAVRYGELYPERVVVLEN